MENLAQKYRPAALDEVCEQSVVIDIVKNICNSGEITNRNFLFIGPAGTGKALPNDEVVLTYDGWVPMSDIEVGTEVITHTGQVAPVIGVYPQGVRPIYKIILRDGATIRVSDNHLNVVATSYTDTLQVLTTDYLINNYSETDFYIPLADIDDHLSRLNLVDNRRKSIFRLIEDIEYEGDDECTCIYVDHPDHTFIAGDYIPTHNTTTARAIARELNDGSLTNVIELDAASHGGVADVKDIIDQMRSYPVGSKYKTFILDECFPGDTLVRTPSGLTPIRDVNEGDTVYNMTGEAAVLHKFENKIKVDNLICLKIGDTQIVTTKNHPFFTNDGWVEASQLKRGDVLYDFSGMQTMWEGIPSNIPVRHKDVLQQGVSSDCFFSEDDRKISLKLAEGMSDMWKDFLNSQIGGCNNVWNSLQRRLEEATSELSTISRRTCEALAYVYVSSVWQGDGDPKQRSSEDVLSTVFSKAEFERSGEEASEISYKAMRELWRFISSNLLGEGAENLQQRMQVCSIRKEEFREQDRGMEEGCIGADEITQSFKKSRNDKEDARNKSSKWDISSEASYAMWKRLFFRTSDSTEITIRRGMGIRISGDDWDKEGRQSESLSVMLQTRSCLAKIDARSRGGWDRPQYEIATTIRRKEDNLSNGLRLEGIEVYKRGNNDELFQSHFPDTELYSSEYVTMYDLEIDGHPSYFVEDILVHNCHAFSSSSWQSLLKVLEEQPAKSLVMLCTTNPEKIPNTILSRVSTFQLSKISLEGIYNRLKYIIECENKEGRGITYDDDALLFIAKSASGGMRDGITNLDQCLSYSNHISIDSVSKALGLPNYDDYFSLLNAVVRKDNDTIVNIINSVYNSGVNFVKWFDGFFSFIINIVKYIYLQDINQTMIPSTYQDKISSYGTAHSALCLKLSNKLVTMNKELKTTQYLQELAISYLCTPPSTKKG